MNYRVLIIRAATFIGGAYFFLKFVLPKEMTLPGVGLVEFGRYNDQISAGLIAIAGVAIGLGLVNLLIGHGGAILFLRRGWIYSAALLAGLSIMLALSFYNWRQSFKHSALAEQFFELRSFAEVIAADYSDKSQTETRLPYFKRNRILQDAFNQRLDIVNSTFAQEAPLRVEGTADERDLLDALKRARGILGNLETDEKTNPTFEANRALAPVLMEVGSKVRAIASARYEKRLSKKLYNLFFDGIFVSLGSAMFSLLGFYIASAAYRAFRIRSVESALMMCAALLVILGQVPFMLFGSGEWGTQLHALFPQIRVWLLTVPNSAAFRAIEIGAAVASLVMAFRMWFSIESENFSGRGGEGA